MTETLSGAFFTFSGDPGSYLSAIDMDGDWLVVCASGATVGGNAGHGAAYLFTKDPEQWERTVRWQTDNEPAAEYFNGIVAVDGNSIAAGAGLVEGSEPAVFLLQMMR